jgi:DNA-binding response OmpR family regulator
MEPALSGVYGDPYGRYRLQGLEAPPVAGRRRPLVILAEFDDGTADLVCLLAESNGYDVRRARDGKQALGMVRALEPDLLVASFRLPGLDGLGLIKAVRSIPDKLVQRIPILVMDVHDNHRDLMAAFAHGADDYLPLPCELQDMLRAWRRVTGHLRRPAPLTALLNGDLAVQQSAIEFLLDSRPEGLELALGELLWQPTPEVRQAVRRTLKRLGTPEAEAVLSRRDRATGKHNG